MGGMKQKNERFCRQRQRLEYPLLSVRQLEAYSSVWKKYNSHIVAHVTLSMYLEFYSVPFRSATIFPWKRSGARFFALWLLLSSSALLILTATNILSSSTSSIASHGSFSNWFPLSFSVPLEYVFLKMNFKHNKIIEFLLSRVWSERYLSVPTFGGRDIASNLASANTQ